MSKQKEKVSLKNRWLDLYKDKRRFTAFVFCAILCAIGILLLAVGFSEASRVAADYTGPDAEADGIADDVMFTHLFLTVPGFLAIGSGFLCFTRKNHRSAAKFVFSSFFITLLGGFLIECFYYQFIHFGMRNPQAKFIVPVALTCLVYCIFFMIFHIIFAVVYGRKKK